MTTAQDVLDVARSQLGVTEGPGNQVPYGTWYGQPGVAWCAQFVSWCGFQAHGSTDLLGKFQYTPSQRQWFEKAGRVSMTPRVGSLVWFNWRNGVRAWPTPQHVGLVESIRSDGRIVTIEGNASDAVKRLVRSTTYICGYGHPAYSIAPAALPAKAPLVVDGRFGPKTIAALQRWLNAQGYRLVVDGKMGPLTRKALQRRLGVKADGKIGPISTRALQRLVGATPDGKWGPKTTAALQRFLNAHGA